MLKLVAIGNRFMKDDGIAIEVAKILEDRLISQNLEIIIGETDFQNCFYLLDEDDYVFILDAIYIGAEPGSIHLFNLKDIRLQPSNSFMQHDMSIIEMIKLYDCKFKGYIIGIEVADIGFGDGLSLVLREKLSQICSVVENNIKIIIMEEFNHV